MCRIKQFSVSSENECWIWNGAKSGDYGKCRWKSKWYSAHKASYLAFKGDISKGLNVCHHCDNKLCVNPSHLYLATQKENIAHAIERNRMHPKKNGERFRILTDEQIEEMRKLKKEGFTYLRLKKIFNVSTAHIFKVVKNMVRR